MEVRAVRPAAGAVSNVSSILKKNSHLVLRKDEAARITGPAVKILPLF